MSNPTYEEQVAACTEPHNHEAFRYCPVCPWTDEGPLEKIKPSGASQIAAERRRQIAVEGYTAAHDDDHDQSDLLAAAYSYVSVGLMHIRPNHPSAAPATYDPPQGVGGWPWLDGWKPDLGDPIPNLVKAGALVAAQIDRIQRGRDA